MNKIALVAIVSAIFAASHAVPTFAQGPRRWSPRAVQPSNVYRPMPGAPSSFPPPQSRVTVDARGNRFVPGVRYATVWDPRQGRWVLGQTPIYGAQGMSQFRPLVDPRVYQAQGTIQAHATTHHEYSAPRGTNQIGASAGPGMNASGSPIHEEIGAPKGTGQLGQPSIGNTTQIQPQSGSPLVVTPTTMISQPATSSYPSQGTATAGAGSQRALRAEPGNLLPAGPLRQRDIRGTTGQCAGSGFPRVNAPARRQRRDLRPRRQTLHELGRSYESL